MSPYQQAREYGTESITVWITETMARCPKCKRSAMDAAWRKLGDGVQCWGECRECGTGLAGGMLPKGASAIEVETRIIERAQKEAAKRAEEART